MVTHDAARAGREKVVTQEDQGLGHRALFLAWAAPSHTRRSELMARRLGIPLRRVRVLKKNKPLLAPLRYAAQAALTLVTLFRERPKVVFVQNPPIFAPLFAWVYCALTRSHLIIDSHTDALQSGAWKWSLPVHRFLSRRALTTLVTNEHLRGMVAAWGARSHIVIDVPSDLPPGQPYQVDRRFNVAMVSSFAPDEPLEEVVEAARSLPEVGFYVTGDPAWGTRRLPADLPPNLRLTGLLPDEDYYGLLRSVQAVMALTKEDHTMQRGACEAVWLSQPIITSNWPVLRESFYQGAVHVDNSVEGIRAGVLRMQADHQALSSGVLALQDDRRRRWREIVAQLEALIGAASNGRRAGS
jgi:glycosyltransferase involved in cell wall biosynthesis